MTAQMAFALPFRAAMGAEDFIVTVSNRRAVEFIDQWPHWPAHIFIVHGAPGSGKTHLAHVWAAVSHAHCAQGNDLAAALETLLHHDNIIVDDIDAVVGDQAREQALFHLCNHIQPRGHMLLTASYPPSHLKVQLPDLKSRLISYPEAALLPPDDTLLAALLIKHFNDRQLRVSQEIIDYLVPRIERSTAQAAQIVAALDRAALAKKSRITIALAREVLTGG